jgi:ferritin-like metal-binding protein YciE
LTSGSALLESEPSRRQQGQDIDFEFRSIKPRQKPNFKLKRRKAMPTKTPRELFVTLLSDARQSTERSIRIYQEISQIAQDPDIKEALESRAWISEKDLSAIDRCFELIGEKPVQLTFLGRLQEVVAEEFRKELGELQNPGAKALFVLATANKLVHLRMAEYTTLVAAADLTGHYAVGVLLESCLADKMAFVERNRRLVRNYVANKLAAKVAAA